MWLSSLWFGLLLLLRAVLAQSAPNGIYNPPELPDEDEEELLDKLATFVAMGGGPGGLDGRTNDLGRRLPIPPEERDFDFDKPIYSDLDLPSLDYINGGGGGGGRSGLRPESGFGPETITNENILEQSLRNLPKQFAYKPDDIRFYIPAEEFPTNSNSAAATPPASSLNSKPVNNNQLNSDKPEVIGALNNDQTNNIQNINEKEDEPILGFHDDYGIGNVVGAGDKTHDRNQAPPHMKKSQDPSTIDAKDEAGIFTEPISQPGHILSSAQGANNPGGPFLTTLADGQSSFSIYYVALIAALSSAGVVGLVGAGICWYRIHERVKATAEVDYPAYGVTGPSKDVSPTGGDRKLAQSAHMYHYQHQKQQMAALQKSNMEGGGGGGDKAGSDVESDDDNEDGDYTVYECPGLAPAGDMEVKNPLFDDEPTPATPSQRHTEIGTEATE